MGRAGTTAHQDQHCCQPEQAIATSKTNRCCLINMWINSGSTSVYLVSILCNVEKFDNCWLRPPALNLTWRILKLPHELTGSLLQVGRDPLNQVCTHRVFRALLHLQRLTLMPRRGSAVVLYFLYFTVGDAAFIVFCACFLGDGMSSGPLSQLSKNGSASGHTYVPRSITGKPF